MGEIRVVSVDIRKAVAHWSKVDPAFVQKNIVAPALRKARPLWKRGLRSMFSVGRGISEVPREGPRMVDVLASRVFARRPHAPDALLTVGARVDKRARRKEGAKGRRVSNQPPAGVRLRFLQGTKERHTHGGLLRQKTARYSGAGRFVRQRGSKRGSIENWDIQGELNNRVEAQSRAVVDAAFQSRAKLALSFRK